MNFKEAPAVTLRPSSTSILAISSRDRFKNYDEERIEADALGFNHSPYDFTITKNESLMNGFFTRLALTEISFDYTIPNINYYTNTIIIEYQVGANPVVSAQYAVNSGMPIFLTPNQLATDIQTHVQGLDPTLTGFTMTYGANGMPFFAYATNSSTTIAFKPLPNGTTYGIASTVVTPNQKQLFDVLGFVDRNTQLNTSEGGNATFGTYTDFIDITCSVLTYNQPLKDTMSQTVARDVIARVFLNQINGSLTGNTLAPSNANFAPPGTKVFQIYHNYTHPKQINWTPNQPVGQLQFVLYDDSGNKISDAVADPEGNWNMTLLVSEN